MHTLSGGSGRVLLTLILEKQVEHIWTSCNCLRTVASDSGVASVKHFISEVLHFRPSCSFVIVVVVVNSPEKNCNVKFINIIFIKFHCVSCTKGWEILFTFFLWLIVVTQIKGKICCFGRMCLYTCVCTHTHTHSVTHPPTHSLQKPPTYNARCCYKTKLHVLCCAGETEMFSNCQLSGVCWVQVRRRRISPVRTGR
jgi:hypothetical protein